MIDLRIGSIHILLFSLCLLCFASCKDKAPSGELQCPPTPASSVPENALSEALLTALGQAQNFHGKADVLVDSGEFSEALAVLQMILEIPFPSDAPEGQDVIADTRARMATLHLELGQLDEALKLVDTGIAEHERQSFYLANLHTVRGQVLQAMAKARDAESVPNAAEGKSLRVEAIKAFDLSIQINEALLQSLAPEESP